jgi:hypothetical protein
LKAKQVVWGTVKSVNEFRQSLPKASAILVARFAAKQKKIVGLALLVAHFLLLVDFELGAADGFERFAVAVGALEFGLRKRAHLDGRGQIALQTMKVLMERGPTHEVEMKLGGVHANADLAQTFVSHRGGLPEQVIDLQA